MSKNIKAIIAVIVVAIAVGTVTTLKFHKSKNEIGVKTTKSTITEKKELANINAKEEEKTATVEKLSSNKGAIKDNKTTAKDKSEKTEIETKKVNKVEPKNDDIKKVETKENIKKPVENKNENKNKNKEIKSENKEIKKENKTASVHTVEKINKKTEEKVIEHRQAEIKKEKIKKVEHKKVETKKEVDNNKFFNCLVYGASPSATLNGSQNMKNKTLQIIKGAKSEKEKAIKIANWISSNVSYSDSLDEKAHEGKISSYELSSEYTFNSKHGICYNYAVLYSNMLEFAGIQSEVVVGTVNMPYGVGTHAWNKVLINNKLISVDTCFNEFGTLSNNHRVQIVIMEV